MFEITVFENGYLNIRNGRVVTFGDFKSLAETLCQLDQSSAEKDGRYWVRGRLSPPERYNHNMVDSRLLVVDADKAEDGKPCSPPAQAHTALIAAGLQHAIYTSHSHTSAKPKYRVVLPVAENMGPHQLKTQTKAIVGLLQAMGVNIAHVREMDAWAQPWFFPRTRNPDSYESYLWTQGAEWELAEGPPTMPETPTADGTTRTLDEHVNNLVTGKEYHSAIIALSMGMCRDGVTRAMNIAIIRALVNQSPESDRRNARAADIDRIVDGGIRRAQEEAMGLAAFALPNVSRDIEAIPLPPGLLGRLVHESWEMMHYRNSAVALVANLGLLCGIMGRRYNIHGTGLNQYFLVAMPTGSGKDFLSKHVSRTLLQISSSSDMYSFMARKRYTGPKALYQQMQDARCCVSVMSELGLMLSSTAGDTAGLRRYLLDLYGKSGQGDVYIGEGYSDSNNNIGTLHSPALTLVGESTPENLSKALINTNAITDGFLPRNLIFRLADEQPYMTANPRKALSAECLTRIAVIAKDCAQIQTIDMPEVYELGFAPAIADDVQAYSRECVDMVNATRGNDVFASAMASRMWLKTCKLAAVASAYNNDNLEIGRDEWEWAKALVKWESDRLVTFMSGGDTGTEAIDAEDLARKIITDIIDLLQKEDQHKRKYPIQKVHRDANIIPATVMRKLLAHKPAIKAMADDMRYVKLPKSGYQKAMDMMVANNYLQHYKRAPVGEPVPAYQLTSKVLEFF